MSFKLLRAKMMHLRMNEVLWVLRIYNCVHDDICFCNVWTTPLALSNAINNTRIACGVDVRFWGGPPGHQHIYDGDLSMFITDRILQAWANDKTKWAWLLQFHTGTVVYIAKQLKSHVPYRQQTLFNTAINMEDGVIPF